MEKFKYSEASKYYDRDYFDTPGVKSGYTWMSRSIKGAWHAQACGWLASVIPIKGKSLLDAGCGLGHFMVAFHALGARVVGCDVSEYCCDFIEANVRLPIIRTALEDMGTIEDNTFDVVYCGATLEHIPAQFTDAALRNLSRVTKPGGMVFLEIDTMPDELRSMPEESHVNIRTWDWWVKKLNHPAYNWIRQTEREKRLRECHDFPGFPHPDWSFAVLMKK